MGDVMYNRGLRYEVYNDHARDEAEVRLRGLAGLLGITLPSDGVHPNDLERLYRVASQFEFEIQRVLMQKPAEELMPYRPEWGILAAPLLGILNRLNLTGGATSDCRRFASGGWGSLHTPFFRNY